MKPLVSAIIPAFNAERYIRDAIESVLSQTYLHIECLVVDDGSTDGTRELVESFAEKVQYVLQENQGVSAARNHGVARATGELIAFLDADDAWLPSKIEKQVEEVTPSIDLVYSGLYLTDECLHPFGEIKAPATTVALRNSVLLQPPVISIAQASLIRRRVFLEAGGFDELLSTSADTDLAIRIACSHQIAAVHEPLVFYRQHGEQMHRDWMAMERDMLRVYAKLFSSEKGREHHLLSVRRRAYGNLYATLSAAAFQRREIRMALTRALRSLCWSPASLATLVRARGGRRFRNGSS
jgi:glycosyltransferase involved in cell wall biosynthesis